MLHKMLDEQSPLWVVFVEGDKKETFDSRVLELNGKKLLLAKYGVAFFLINLDGVAFGYADPRETSDPEMVAAHFEYCLALGWQSGARCRLFVVTTSSK